MPDAGKDRIIFHIDCNAFFASVEEVFRPELKKVPMAICGDPESRHGIILAKNELAKGYGIKTAETIWQAKRKCPGLVLARARHGVYGEYCELINSIYEQYTGRVERFGIDESYLDVTTSLHLFGGDSIRLADEIRRRVAAQTGITVSVGVSYNKIFAKLASDMKKPDATTLISRENYRRVVWPLPASALLMVGRTTEKALRDMYIRTIGDIALAGERELVRRMGKMGEQLYLYANGLDSSPVREAGDRDAPHSIGNHMTFSRNLQSDEDIKTAVTHLADKVASRLRRKGLKCANLQVTIKDTNLKMITRQKQMPAPSFTAADIAGQAMEIIKGAWRIGVPIRMLALTGQKLMDAGSAPRQLALFTDVAESERRERREKAVDYIRGMFGPGSISPGCVIGNDIGISTEGRHK